MIDDEKVPDRGGTSPNFWALSQARASSVEPEWPWACQNSPRVLFTNQNAEIRVWVYFEPFGKLGSTSLEPGAYLLRAKTSARGQRAQARSTSSPWSKFQQRRTKRNGEAKKSRGIKTQRNKKIILPLGQNFLRLLELLHPDTRRVGMTEKKNKF